MLRIRHEKSTQKYLDFEAAFFIKKGFIFTLIILCIMTVKV